MDDECLDIMIMRQLMNVSSDNLDPITQTFVSEDLMGEIGQKIGKFVECLPSIITLRPDSSPFIIQIAHEIMVTLSEEQTAEFKKAILQRLIHNFQSKDIIHRYASIANFLYTAVSKSLFQSYEVANAVHSLMISKPKNHQILTHFFFWFAPHFSDLSGSFLRSLKQHVEVEQISRTLPPRYKTLYTRVNEFMQQKWAGYDDMKSSPLTDAIRSDDLLTVKQLVRQNGRNQRYEAHPFEIHWMLLDNPTLVQVCAYFGAVKCFTFLKQKGADLTLLDAKGRSVADFAAVSCNTEIIKMLVAGGCAFRGALDSIVMFHHEHIVHVLPDIKASELGSSVNAAIMSNNFSCFAKCETRASTELVMRAVECESSLIFRKIVSLYGSSIDFNEMCCGRSVLDVAVETQQMSIISWLLGNETVDVNIRNAAGKTPLQVAVETLNPSVISLLLECPRVDTDVRWDSGKSILHEAILRGGIDAVREILKCERFDANCRDNSGKTGLHYATRNINSMGTHIVIDSGINAERLLPERYVFSYSKLVHTYILNFLHSCFDGSKK